MLPESQVGVFPPAETQVALLAARSRRRSAIVVVLFVGLAAVGAYAWLRRPRAVVVTPIVRGTAVSAVYATGTVDAYDRVVVKSKAVGTIDELLVREGARVNKGDLLARIGSRPVEADLTRGRVQLDAARSRAAPRLIALQAQARALQARLVLAKAEFARRQRLVQSSSLPLAELEAARTEVTDLEAQLQGKAAEYHATKIDLDAQALESRAELDALSARASDLEVRAPLDGVVLARSVELGEVVAINQPLFRVGDVTNLVLDCSVDEADMGRIRVGASTVATFYAFPKQVIAGAVVDIFPDADPKTKNFLVQVRLLERPEGLRTGMTAEVNIVIDEHPNALIAPAQAIDSASTVWRVVKGRVSRTQVGVGVRSVARAEILSGLSEGDVIVVAGADELQNDARVQEMLLPPPKLEATGASSAR